MSALRGQDLLKLRAADARDPRQPLSMIFQEPMTSLNPVFTVGAQIAEALRIARRGDAGAGALAMEMLRQVGIPDRPSSAPTTIRTSSPAACASA